MPLCDADEMEDILRVSRLNNQRYGITGLLLCHDHTILQFLEGEDSIVDAVYVKITRDSRHKGVISLLRRHIQARDFSRWDMEFRALHDGDAELQEFKNVVTGKPRVMSDEVLKLIDSYRRTFPTEKANS